MAETNPLLRPLTLGSRTVKNRVVFGPHETNLGRRRAVSDRHVAYYARRAAGGAGVVVVEEASVHPSDWPYERCPLADDCAPGWAAVAAACHEHGALALAAVGHAGGQGSSAYSQAPLWAPSRVPEVASREVPKWMEDADVEAVIAGFASAARTATAAGLDGVEVNAGQFSLVRQFLSGLTNHRGDRWGADRTEFARAALVAVRAAAGPDAVVGLRLSFDELAPWAGLVPEAAVEVAAALAEYVDYVTVVRGSIFTTSATRPDTHVGEGFNLGLVRAAREALPASVAVVAQGSLVDPVMAAGAVAEGACDAVEMTRAQIAEPDLVAKIEGRVPGRPRPCILCNQACQVRDARNPIVSCVGEPRSGHEWEEADPGPAAAPVDVLVVGGGPAGLECARAAATAGHSVRLLERGAQLGGMLRVAATASGRSPLSRLVDWLEEECRRLGVDLVTGSEVTAEMVEQWPGEVVFCTGGRPGLLTYQVDADAVPVVTAAELLEGRMTGASPLAALDRVAVWDPIGGPIGVSLSETLRAGGAEVFHVTPDLVPGNELSRTGDLAPANTRLQGAGVNLERRSLLRRVTPAGAEVEDRFTGARRTLAVSAVVDAGYRLPEDSLWRAADGRWLRAGDAVAPRSAYEAVLEGRRAAALLGARAGQGAR